MLPANRLRIFSSAFQLPALRVQLLYNLSPAMWHGLPQEYVKEHGCLPHLPPPCFGIKTLPMEWLFIFQPQCFSGSIVCSCSKQIILELLSSWLRCILQVAKGTSFMFCQAFRSMTCWPVAASSRSTAVFRFRYNRPVSECGKGFQRLPAPYVCMPYNRLSEPAL